MFHDNIGLNWPTARRLNPNSAPCASTMAISLAPVAVPAIMAIRRLSDDQVIFQ
jgi:hypothetical protein